MLGTLVIVKAGLMTSIQDLGREGLSYYAIAKSGAMDIDSAKIANLLLRKPEADPVIEITSIAPTLQFLEATEIAIAGADFEWKLNDKAVLLNQRLTINKGDVLRGGKATKGLRGYIAILGQIDIDPTLRSYSTQLNTKLGGFQGRALKKGDVLKWSIESENSLKSKRIKIYKGPEYNWLTPNSEKSLSEEKYKISPDSNRMGMRLQGKSLNCESHQLEQSAPLLPGFIQLPPSGQPIIVLQDGNTTGGYPRIAYIRTDDLGRLNQIRIGEEIHFFLEN